MLAPIESELGPDERTLLLLNQLSDARAERRLRGTIVVADRAVAVAANGAYPVIHAQALITRSYLRTIGGSIASDQQLIEQAEHDIAQAIELVDGLSASHAAHALSVQGLNRMITGDLTGASASLSAAIERSRDPHGEILRASVTVHLAVNLAATLHVLGEQERAASLVRGGARVGAGEHPDWGRVGTIAAIMGGGRAIGRDRPAARLLRRGQAVTLRRIDRGVVDGRCGRDHADRRCGHWCAPLELGAVGHARPRPADPEPRELPRVSPLRRVGPRHAAHPTLHISHARRVASSTKKVLLPSRSRRCGVPRATGVPGQSG